MFIMSRIVWALIGFFVGIVVPQTFFSPLGGGWLALISGLITAAVLWWAVGLASNTLAGAILAGAACLGAIGFLGGVLGPIVINPENHAGPILGIKFTGPIGFVLGFPAGALWWRYGSHRSK